MQIITQREAARLMRTSGGRIFSVSFIKRSNGARRRMIGRMGVTQGVTGEGKKFNDRDHDLVTVFELVGAGQNAQGRHANGGKQFRHVPIEGIESLRIAGTEYEVSGY